ncbi:putative signal transducing protein [Sphingomonas sp. ASY06-1R]|jgi:hypothetical protein|uniref:putative signal transducing protein n=1 Tax=Sphingomonas sp. ASY06-1R TaxID=3445771 RepID=UPI003FA28E6A
MSLVELARYTDRAEIALARSRLASADIESFVFDQDMLLVPARLMVLDDDEAAARQVLGSGV